MVAAPATAARPKCDGKAATIVSYKKVIRGTSKADVIVAKGNKNNVIYGKGARDRICGGAGNDTIYGGSGNDRLFGGSGNDALYGQVGKDDIFGFGGTDVINGGDNGDFIKGGLGDDRIEGAAGDDTVKGGAGPDSISGAAGDDKLYGQAGNDQLNGGAGSDLCEQGPGTGPLTDCEAAADLAAGISGPRVGLRIRTSRFRSDVLNFGPADSAYGIPEGKFIADGADCSRAADWSGYVQPVLSAPNARSHTMTVNCSLPGGTGSGQVRIWFQVGPIDTFDPYPGDRRVVATVTIQ